MVKKIRPGWRHRQSHGDFYSCGTKAFNPGPPLSFFFIKKNVSFSSVLYFCMGIVRSVLFLAFPRRVAFILLE